MTCRHCGADDVERLLRHRRGATYRCTRCGGYSNDPGQDTDALYDHDYFLRNYRALEQRQIVESRWCLERIRGFVPSGSILDYGCGTGVFLGVAPDFGFEGNVGADVSADALRIARQSVGDRAEWVHLATDPLPARTFEVVTFMNSLAGLERARQVVGEIRDRHLAPGGILAIRSPNVPARYVERVGRLGGMLGPRVTGALLFAKARHLLFDPQALPRFLESLGFEVLSMDLRRDHPIPIRLKPFRGLVKSLCLRLIQPHENMFVIARVNGGGEPDRRPA